MGRMRVTKGNNAGAEGPKKLKASGGAQKKVAKRKRGLRKRHFTGGNLQGDKKGPETAVFDPERKRKAKEKKKKR